MVRILTYLYVYLFLITLSSVLAEEMLIKGEAKYLGWQTGKDDFKDCKKKPIKIGKGKVEKTDEICGDNGPIGPLMIKGSVESVDVNKMTFRIKDENGQPHNFFFLTVGGEENIRLEDLKVGDKVTVTAPIPERAAAIARITGNGFDGGNYWAKWEKGIARSDTYTIKAARQGNYWAKWEKGIARGIVPPCGTNVLPLGGDEILQAMVDTYCAVKPGKYESYINPAVIKIYKARGTNYPDGKTAVLEFKELGVAFTTDHKNGKPIYNVIPLKDGKSVASKEKGHPLNPETCANCHARFGGVCKGYMCGNRQ